MAPGARQPWSDPQVLETVVVVIGRSDAGGERQRIRLLTGLVQIETKTPDPIRAARDRDINNMYSTLICVTMVSA